MGPAQIHTLFNAYKLGVVEFTINVLLFLKLYIYAGFMTTSDVCGVPVSLLNLYAVFLSKPDKHSIRPKYQMAS